VRDLVDQAELLRLLGRDRSAGGHHLHRLGHRDDARQALRAARAWQDAELHLGKAELRVGRRDAVMAGERELQAAAEREAADRGDQRFRQRVLRVVDLRQVWLEARRGELADVGAPGKGLCRSDEDGRLDRGIGLGLFQVLQDRRAQGVAEAVDGRVIESNDGDAVADGVSSDFAHPGVSGG
jgi:hypothetical protein